jgi:putative ABC transport system permease protein
MVAQEGAADLSFSIVPEEAVPALSDHPGVDNAEGMLFHVARVGSNPYFFLMGREHAGLAAYPPALVFGEIWPEDTSNGILLGQRAADDLDVAPGETVVIEDTQFTVFGIYKTGRLLEDGGAYAPLDTVQGIAGRSGVVTAVFVSTSEGADPEGVGQSIEEQYPGQAS